MQAGSLSLSSNVDSAVLPSLPAKSRARWHVQRGSREGAQGMAQLIFGVLTGVTAGKGPNHAVNRSYHYG